MEGTRLERLEILFKSLSDPARLRILGLLAERPHAGYELARRMTLTPPTISHHMRRLVDAGLVAVTPQSPAQRIGLQPGDEFLEFDRWKQGTYDELRTAITCAPAATRLAGPRPGRDDDRRPAEPGGAP